MTDSSVKIKRREPDVLIIICKIIKTQMKKSCSQTVFKYNHEMGRTYFQSDEFHLSCFAVHEGVSSLGDDIEKSFQVDFSLLYWSVLTPYIDGSIVSIV